MDYIRLMKHSFPTDVIVLSEESLSMLGDLCQPYFDRIMGDQNRDFVPADLLMSNTVPLLDCEIILDGIMDRFRRYRVKIFPEYYQLLCNSRENNNEQTVVGLFEILDSDDEDGFQIVPLSTTGFGDEIELDCEWWWNQIEQKYRYPFSPDTKAELVNHGKPTVWYRMIIWYAIQIALLHPVVRTIFSNPARNIVNKKQSNSKSKNHRKQAPVRYVKKHIINSNELQKLIYGESNSKTYQRKALIWYVIGHWRTYKNGKRVFVQPHWKGALRDTNLTQSRERELILN